MSQVITDLTYERDELVNTCEHLKAKLAQVEADRDSAYAALNSDEVASRASNRLLDELCTLRATAKRRLELLRKLDVFPCPICGGGITSHGSHKPDCPLAAELKEAGE